MTLSIQSAAQASKINTQFIQTKNTVLSQINSLPVTLKLFAKILVGFTAIRGAVAENTDGYCGRLSSSAASIKLFTSAYDCAGVKEAVENLMQDCTFFSENESEFTKAIPDFSVDVSGTKTRIENPHVSMSITMRERQKPGAVEKANYCVSLATQGLASIDRKKFPITMTVANSTFHGELEVANHQIFKFLNESSVNTMLIKALPEDNPRPQIVHFDNTSKAKSIVFESGNGFVNVTNADNIPDVKGGVVHLNEKIVKMVENNSNVQNRTQHDEF